jgi:hypothetical protein
VSRNDGSFGIILRVCRPRASTLVLMTGPLVAILDLDRSGMPERTML